MKIERHRPIVDRSEQCEQVRISAPASAGMPNLDLSGLFVPMRQAKIGVLVVPEYSLICLAGAYEPFRKAKDLLGPDRIKIDLLSIDGKQVSDCEGRRIETDRSIVDAEGYFDAIIVVASFNAMQYWTPVVGSFLRRNSRQGALIAGADIGVWFLAKAGLLDGKRATVHWGDSPALQAEYPNVSIGPEGYVIDGRVVTASGGSAMLPAAIEMIEMMWGTALATEVAHLFNIVNRNDKFTQQHSALFQRLSQLDPFLATATRLMHENIHAPLSIPELASRAGTSQRILNTIFRRHRGKSALACYLEERLKIARHLVLSTNKSMGDIADACGFTSLNSFSRAYHDHFGASATAHRADRSIGRTSPDNPAAA